MERLFADFTFVHIGRIMPEMDETNGIRAYSPQTQYRKRTVQALHAYGAGPFCRFRIPKQYGTEGVYVLTVEDDAVYVGECQHLSKRYNVGYGQISPRNCYQGGQSTNCRLNNLIYQATKQLQRVDLWFLETSDRLGVERMLIQKLSTRRLWNRKD